MSNYPTAGLFRRFMAMFYDSLIILAILIFITAIAMVFTKGEAIQPSNTIYKLSIWISIFVFFIFFWLKGGQTLGMLAWRLKLVTQGNEPVGLTHIFMRILTAIPSISLLGIGMFWILIDKNNYAWHDNWSDTKVILLPKGSQLKTDS